MAPDPRIARNNSCQITAYHYSRTYPNHVQRNSKRSLLVSRTRLGCYIPRASHHVRQHPAKRSHRQLCSTDDVDNLLTEASGTVQSTHSIENIRCSAKVVVIGLTGLTRCITLMLNSQLFSVTCTSLHTSVATPH